MPEVVSQNNEDLKKQVSPDTQSSYTPNIEAQNKIYIDELFDGLGDQIDKINIEIEGKTPEEITEYLEKQKEMYYDSILELNKPSQVLRMVNFAEVCFQKTSEKITDGNISQQDINEIKQILLQLCVSPSIEVSPLLDDYTDNFYREVKKMNKELSQKQPQEGDKYRQEQFKKIQNEIGSNSIPEQYKGFFTGINIQIFNSSQNGNISSLELIDIIKSANANFNNIAHADTLKK